MASRATPSPATSLPVAETGKLRSDAERNRQAILVAATEAFTRQGLDASLEDIASNAGVGSATLYRRFPTRDDLITAALQQRVTAYADLVEQACVGEDAWDGFCGLLHAICELQATDAGLSDLLTRSHREEASPIGIQIRRGRRALGRLVARAKSQGKLRSDFVVEDVTLLFKANAGLLRADGTDQRSPTRLTNYMIDAFREPAADR
jgi:AcrR family transcriptional regulator